MKDNNGYELNMNSELPEKGDPGKVFELPENYFLKFEDKLRQKMEMQDELKEYTILSAIPKQTAFCVPDNYFESLEVKAELQAYPELQGIAKKIFTPDAVYLKESELQILQKAELADELRPYDLLYKLDKVNVFTLPAAYFEQLPALIKEKVYTPEKQYVNVFDGLIAILFGRKLALTFAVLLLGAIGVYLYKLNYSPENVAEDCKTMACLEKKELLNQQVLSRFNEDELMEMVDVKKLDQQIKAVIPKGDQKQEEEFILDQVNTDQLIDEL